MAWQLAQVSWAKSCALVAGDDQVRRVVSGAGADRRHRADGEAEDDGEQHGGRDRPGDLQPPPAELLARLTASGAMAVADGGDEDECRDEREDNRADDQ